MTEYGDVIGTISIAHKLALELRDHPDIEVIIGGAETETWSSLALRMKDGTIVTITIQSDYDPEKDPYIA